MSNGGLDRMRLYVYNFVIMTSTNFERIILKRAFRYKYAGMYFLF